MRPMIVSINGKEYHLRYGLRCLFKYEQISGHPYTAKTLEDTYLLLHAALIACNEDYTLTFEDLIDACDNDDRIFSTFLQLIDAYAKRLGPNKKKARKKLPNR